MKKDLLYPYYLTFLNVRLNSKLISIGSYSLSIISKDAFHSFKYKFERDELFSKKVIEIYKSENRDQKINDILNETN